MKIILKKIDGVIIPIFFLIYTAVILLKALNFGVPGRDSGAFLYAGKELLLGNTPYLDFWDHKAPLIYFINAIAIAINGHNLWGLWLVETISLFVALYALYIAMAKLFNKKVSLLATIFGGIAISQLLEGGNRVEEFGFLFQILALLVFVIIQKHPARKGSYYVFGALCSLIFLLKPNMVSILPSAVLLLAIIGLDRNNIKSTISHIIKIAIGFSSVLGVFVLYFLIQKALPDAYDQIFHFNFLYTTSTWTKRVLCMTYGLKLLWPSLVVAALGVVSYFLFGKPKKIRYILIFAIVWLLTEIFVSSASGREEKHYFISWVAPLSLLISLYFFQIKNKHLLFVVSIVMFFFAYKNITMDLIKNTYVRRPFDKTLQFRGFLFNNFDEHSDTLKVISDSSNPGDNILIWGSEPSLLFLSSRRTASRYYYQFRLFYPGYNLDDTKTEELYEDIVNNPPKLIIDASNSTYDSNLSNFSMLPPLDKKKMMTWFNQTNTKQTKYLTAISDFVSKNYTLWKTTYSNSWTIYKWNNPRDDTVIDSFIQL